MLKTLVKAENVVIGKCEDGALKFKAAMPAHFYFPVQDVLFSVRKAYKSGVGKILLSIILYGTFYDNIASIRS